MKIIMLMSMMFLHIVDDFYLQGILAKMKQKSWWKENTSDELYKNDYIIALVEHAFSWTFMMMFPITLCMIFRNELLCTPSWRLWFVLFVFNVVFHSLIDELKANLFVINLLQDQLFHIVQIFLTWLILVVC